MTKSEFVQRHVNFSYCDIVDKADALAGCIEDRSNYVEFDEV